MSKEVKLSSVQPVEVCFDQGEKHVVIGDEEGGEPVEECPTCLGFSPHCCQREDGWVLLARLVRHHC